MSSLLVLIVFFLLYRCLGLGLQILSWTPFSKYYTYLPLFFSIFLSLTHSLTLSPSPSTFSSNVFIRISIHWIWFPIGHVVYAWMFCALNFFWSNLYNTTKKPVHFHYEHRIKINSICIKRSSLLVVSSKWILCQSCSW